MEISQRNPLQDKIQGILTLQIDEEDGLIDSLNAIEKLIPDNTVRNRRSLRSKVEQQQSENYNQFLDAFTDVKKRVDQLDVFVNRMFMTCQSMNKQLLSVKHQVTSLVNDAKHLQRESEKQELKADILDAIINFYKISPSDVSILSSDIHPINDEFFAALSRGCKIKNNCKNLVQTNEFAFGLTMMDEVIRILEEAFERLYRWIQNQCKSKTAETPDITSELRRALAELQNRPVLFKYSLDEYCAARKSWVVKSFIGALTVGTDTSFIVDHSTISGHAKPIELYSHDPIRFASDMLACIHQLTASEREYLSNLLENCHDPIIADLQTSCLDAITDSLCLPLKIRMEHLLVAQHDAVILYRINNLLNFYKRTLSSLLDCTARLNSCLCEMQEFCRRLLFNTLNQYIQQALEQPDHPNMDLSPNDIVRDTLQLLVQILSGHDISLLSPEAIQTEFKEIIDSLIPPLINYCEKSADLLTHNSQSRIDLLSGGSDSGIEAEYHRSLLVKSVGFAYLINCLYMIQTRLTQLKGAESQIEHIATKLDEYVDYLVAAQVAVVLINTNLIGLVRVLQNGHDPNRDGPLISRTDIVEGELSEAQVRNILVLFDAYLSNPDRLCLPELHKLDAQRLRKMIRRRAADHIHGYYQSIFEALINPANGYQSFSDSYNTAKPMSRLRTPKQVAELILNF